MQQGWVDLGSWGYARVERRGCVDFLAKYVRPEKVDGRYLPEQAGGEPIWHWTTAALREQTA